MEIEGAKEWEVKRILNKRKVRGVIRQKCRQTFRVRVKI